MTRTGNGPPRRPESGQLARQWAILRLLSDSGRAFSIAELSEQLGASKSSIQRDIKTLQQEFALVEEKAGKQKGVYRIDASLQSIESIRFGMLELLAVHAAASAAPLEGTPFADDLQQVLVKMRGYLGEHQNHGIGALSRVFLPHWRGAIDYRSQQGTIDDLTDAIARRRKCRATYYAAWRGKTRDHLFRPLRLVWHRGSLYLLCALDGLSEITTLAVQRIQSLEVLDEPFPPPRLNVEDHVRRAFGIFVSDAEEDVEIVFDEAIAWRVEERTYHPDEHKERQGDGSLLYRVRSSAQWEIVPWVLSFGVYAELRKPDSWRQAIAETARALAERHAGD